MISQKLNFTNAFKKNTSSSEPDLLTRSKTQEVTLKLNQYELPEQLKLIRLTEDDLRIMKYFKPVLSGSYAKIVDKFYETLLKNETLSAIIHQHTTVERLKQTFVRHLTEMLEGRFDETFLKQRIKVAQAHARIHLEPKWYIGAFQLLQQITLETVYEHIEDKRDYNQFVGAISKIFNIEQQIVLESYFDQYTEAITEKIYANDRMKERIEQAIDSVTTVTQQTTASLQELSTSSSEIMHTANQTAQNSNVTQSRAKDGYQKLEKLNSQIMRIKHSAQEMKQYIEELGASTQEISGVIKLVKEIADQTNLLSLNSSIEAARAGEHGLGFAVVANEIKNLSQQTSDAVKRIGTLITQNNTNLNNVFSTLQEVEEIVELGVKESEDTKVSFDEIIDSMDNHMEHLEKSFAELKHYVDVINQVNQTTEALTASMEELKKESQVTT